ncbi:CpaF family protein [Thermincola potens]|uniref:Type II secretion system protein E n=1 Tax=Thermincola potens (strain JR) TaxID=635013 RepID=D5XAS5_THEPJ|nr:CpaF family protein [Thermincola potens]ADG83279.1 type II secretion system protein E [Thermincola potens JR]
MVDIAKEDMIQLIRDEVGYRLDLSKELQDEEIKDVITQVVFEKSKQNYLTLLQKQELIAGVFNSMRRLDVLQPLLEDPAVTEIMVNGPDNIFIEKNGRTYQLDIKFEGTEKLENVIQSIVSRVNRVVNEAMPIVDARLPDGSRVNVVLPPIALRGPTMTIRKFPEQHLTVEKLIELGSLSEEAAELLKKLVQARYNIFVSGGTGSGKTTFLNALSDFIPPHERIITIEDSAELQLKNIKNLVSLETRNANTEGKGEITTRDLIKTSLRMRPDRIIVGEVRGAEALDMLQAMNTGHDGSLSTGHANTTKDMLSRLETMVLSAAPLPVEVIRKQIAAALDIIIHLGRLRDGTRKVLEICEVEGFAHGDIVLNPLFRFQEEGEVDQRVIGNLKRTGKLLHRLKLKMAGLSLED